MDSFEQQFSSHGVHDVVSQLSAALEQSSLRDISEDAIRYLDRIRQGLAFIVARLGVTSPVLATDPQLDRIQKPLQNCLNELNQFNTNGNAAHLANGSNQLDGALAAAATLVSLSQPDPTVTASDVIGFKELAERAIDSIRERVEAVSSQSVEISDSFQKLQTGVDEQTQRVATLGAQISSKLDELQSSFSSAQTTRQSAYDNLLEEFRKTNSDKLATLQSAADEKIGYLEKRKGDAERIVHLIGNIGVTGNFRGAATRDAKLANIFRIIALACFLSMVVVILYMGFISLHEQFDLWLALFRFAIGFAFLVPGVYAARESSKHQILENRNRKKELELASIDNYLDSLEKAKKDEIKSELSMKYFGGDDVESGTDNDVTSKSLIELLTAAIKALGGK